ncbi:MAG: tRNA (N6-threonylcarbamoyladenosine(37)-N6)-methyltransferase TrmO [Firmicutes bacterium]|nr:tRNA (N6-threonylcarbamoyladenosine(37)-N6)-methyltransferase TrmO [Bacillota bacterium]
MSEKLELTVLAHIYNDYQAKFGVPRQSGLVDEVISTIVFEPEFRREEAFRGLEGFSHLWLLWHFSESHKDGWSATVRPPRLGGNRRVGVFASRSPFRPNPIGLSCVRLVEIKQDKALGPVLLVSGADLLNGTPIFDVKPYVPYADAHPEALGGFAVPHDGHLLAVDFAPALLASIPEDKQEALLAVLAQDPRPSYQNDAERVYGLSFGGFDVRFTVADDKLTVVQVLPLK